MTREDRRQLFKGLAFISPWIIGFALFLLLPIILSFYYSLCDYSLLKKPMYIGASNYVEMAHDQMFWKSLKNTIVFALMALPAGMIVSLALAVLLNVSVKGQPIFRTMIYLPSLVPAVASAMLWMWIYNGKLGLLNFIARKIGLTGSLHVSWLNRFFDYPADKINTPLSLPPDWLGDDRMAMFSLALMSVWGVGNTVVIYLAGLQDVPKELYEAAEIDGATGWRSFWNVTIPMISPVIFFNLIMAIIGTFQVFGTPYLMTGGGPDNATYFYTMYLYDHAFTNLKMGYASALAWVQFLIILMLTAIAFWTSKRWVHFQGK